MAKQNSLFKIVLNKTQWDNYYYGKIVAEPNKNRTIAATKQKINRDIDSHFVHQLGMDGKTWLPRVDKLPHPLLIKKFIMKPNIQDAKTEKNPDGGSVTFKPTGAAAKYAHHQQLGSVGWNGTRGEGKIPPRSYAWISQSALNDIANLWALDYI